MVDKKILRQQFSQEWKKHYNLRFFQEKGFVRKKCKLCGRYFWTLDPDREVCGDPAHGGYQFVGNPTGEKRDYGETWRVMAEFYKKQGHAILPRYPVVARWRDDLYFTIASIAVFQPYVVRGDVDPPANPLLIPQPCLRFTDVDNVGLSGRHLTSFVMVGQHAFNRDRDVVWKEAAVEQMFNFLTDVLRIPKEEIVFHEDVWAGGGNFGPSLEYFVRGLELGNIVFMQYEETESGPKELKIRVLDHGIGLARMVWVTNGTNTIYDVVFPSVLNYLHQFYQPKSDESLLVKFYNLAGMINFDEIEDFAKLRKQLEQEFGSQIFEDILPLSALYSIADHTRTLLFAATDGAFPSNVRGGYNLRTIARRAIYLADRYGWDVEWGKLFELHAKDAEILFPELKEGVKTAIEAFEEERKKYQRAIAKGKRRVLTILKKKGKLDISDFIELYQSHGIPPELASEIANQEVPPGIYAQLKRESGRKKEKKVQIKVPDGIPETRLLYYEDPYLFSFEARVVGVWEDWVFLDRTAFYPEGGGQEADRGTLNDIQVLDVQKVGKFVAHKVERNTFRVGQRVVGKVDRERRLALMRHHTSAHILLAAARRVLGQHVWQEGAHKAQDVAHLDISHYRSITPDELKRIEEEANKIVMECHTVKTYWMPRMEAEQKFGIRIYQGGAVPGAVLRIVEIEGVDVEACGGTHVKNTGEIGMIKIIRRESVADGVERLVYVAGSQAIRYVQELEEQARKAADVLRVGIKELEAGARRLLDKYKSAEKEKEKLLESLCRKLKGNLIVLDYFPPEGLKYVSGVRAIVSRSGKPNVFLWKPSEELLELLKEHGFRGGGREWVIGTMDVNIAEKLLLQYFSQKRP